MQQWLFHKMIQSKSSKEVLFFVTREFLGMLKLENNTLKEKLQCEVKRKEDSSARSLYCIWGNIFEGTWIIDDENDMLC